MAAQDDLQRSSASPATSYNDRPLKRFCQALVTAIWIVAVTSALTEFLSLKPVTRVTIFLGTFWFTVGCFSLIVLLILTRLHLSIAYGKEHESVANARLMRELMLDICAVVGAVVAYLCLGVTAFIQNGRLMD